MPSLLGSASLNLPRMALALSPKDGSDNSVYRYPQMPVTVKIVTDAWVERRVMQTCVLNAGVMAASNAVIPCVNAG